jgi:hypothetical protein
VAHAWPYNRWKWDESQTWWIAPAPDRLAFRYAKIIVSTSARLAESDQIFVGLYVEKGVGGALASAGYYPDEWVLKPTWRWHDVVADLASGALGPATAAASQQIGEPVEVRADAHVPVVKASVQPPHDSVAYATLDGIALTSTAYPVLVTEQHFLENAAGVHTVPQLAKALQTIVEADSAWINLYVGRALRISTVHDTSAIDADQLADRLLEPFSPWLK